MDGGGVIDPRISSHLMHHASLNDACSYGQIQLRGCECVWVAGEGGLLTHTLSVPV